MKLNQVRQPARHAAGRRFLTNLDLAIIKHDDAVLNARVKRGELPSNDRGKDSIYMCGCGAVGCAIHLRHIK